MGTLVTLAALGAAAVFAVSIYNRLVRLRNTSESAWSDVDVQLKRRYELIPNLVETVKGFAAHEKSTFEEVTRARSAAMGANTVQEHAEAERGLASALRGLFAVAEAYPQLKANENFLSLQSQLSALEDAIQNARRYYNAVVRDLNTSCDTFPSNLVASAFGIVKHEYFELDDEAERSAPVVSFSS